MIINTNLFILLMIAVTTAKATTLHSESENQCRLHTTTELRCDGDAPTTSLPNNHDNRPLAVGKAGPKGQPGQKGEPGTSCTTQDCLAKTAEYDELFKQITSCFVEEITNANHNASTLIRHNEAVTYECVSGYFTESVKTRKCQFGRLVPSFALYPFVCDQGCLVTGIDHASSDAPKGTHVKSNNSINYSCDAGYTTSDVVERTCRGSEIAPSFEEEPLVCHADCTSVDRNFDRGTVQLPLVHGEKAVITCDPGYMPVNTQNVYCRDGFVDLTDVVCKEPTYIFVNKKLSWLNSQKYCVDNYQGNLASYGLETVAARKQLADRFNTQEDFTIGIRRVSGTWVRVDGSALPPTFEYIWYPGYGVSDKNYMRVRGIRRDYIERLGMIWNYDEDNKQLFVCEN